jgi:hypothetical protein
MIRNDLDIAIPFLAQAEELFDQLLIVDVQSTDGTKEAISSFPKTNTKIRLYSINRQEKYQSAIMNRLARTAFDEGADWIFLLDADEFINVESREAFQRYLGSFSDDVMHLPWINLVPSEYGTFTSFDTSQTFYWSGRTSFFHKIALSSLFIANNPDFYIHEGNHSVSRDFTSPPFAPTPGGLTLLHLPVRSADRFKYKMATAKKTLSSKHNRLPGEGTHVEAISNLMHQTRLFVEDELTSIAAHYGDNEREHDHIDPIREGWPNIRLNEYVLKAPDDIGLNVSLTDTLLRDQVVKWRQSGFVAGSAVSAAIEGDNIEIRPQPIMGNGKLFHGRYARLPDSNPQVSPTVDANLIIEAINASFMKIKILTFSAWTELVPALFCILSIARPRRFVELGTHNGMCFFAACQATEALALDTQCIAVDNWLGDPHASFHADEVFDNFRATFRNNFPDQFYLKANFRDALECFEDGSIDLLHIDGFHAYSAVKDDFETWLPKMSHNGIILFHDINVHERGFGVWRLWAELEEQYPSFSLWHCHGLGIICVGSQPSGFAEIMTALHNNPGYGKIVRTFLEAMGQLSVDYRRQLDRVRSSTEADDQIRRLNDQIRALGDEISRRDEEIGRRNEEIGRRNEEARKADANLNLLIFGFWQRDTGYAGQPGQSRRTLASLLSAINTRLFSPWRKDVNTIRQSNLFDSEYYLASYPDVKNAKVDPILHFVRHGVYELRNPNATFDTRNYLLMNKDVLLNRMNPFVHYIKFGRTENRLW